VRLALQFAMRTVTPLLAATSAVLVSLALPPTDLSFLAWGCLVPLLFADPPLSERA
jgi:apolipoprotein N-acyltransferase